MLRLSTNDSSQLQIVDLRSNTVVASGALSQISGVRIIGADYANDSLKVDALIPFSLKDGIYFDGGKGGFDTLSVIGPKGGTVGYTPIGSSGGSIRITGASASLNISFTGLEPVTVSGVTSYSFTTSGAAPAGSGNHRPRCFRRRHDRQRGRRHQRHHGYDRGARRSSRSPSRTLRTSR